WRGAGRVVVVDAASGGKPGTVRRFQAHREPLPAAALHGSTHSWGVAEAVETARALGELPPRIVVYAIFGRCFDPGARRLSLEVRRAVVDLAEALTAEISRPGEKPSALGVDAG